jgi:hypothetical protein
VRNLTRIGHVLRLENFIEGFLGDPLLLQNKLLDAQARLEGLFGDGHRFLTAEHRVEGSHQADAVLHIVAAPLPVGLNPHNAAAREHNTGILENHQAMKTAMKQNICMQKLVLNKTVNNELVFQRELMDQVQIWGRGKSANLSQWYRFTRRRKKTVLPDSSVFMEEHLICLFGGNDRRLQGLFPIT